MDPSSPRTVTPTEDDILPTNPLPPTGRIEDNVTPTAHTEDTALPTTMAASGNLAMTLDVMQPMMVKCEQCKRETAEEM